MIIAGYNITKQYVSGGMFSTNKAVVKAVQGVNIKIKEKETVGLVGESGSGKTTLARLLIGLEEVTEGSVLFNISDDELNEYEEALKKGDEGVIKRIEGKYDITKIPKSRLRKLRRYMSIVFQDPYSSLDPRLTVIDIIKEPMIATGYLSGEEANKRVLELLEKVGLPKWFAYRYPHELSGGQRQRVAIARALSTNPKFIALDEPTSALDVSTQAQILNLLKSLQREEGLSYLLITHNISVASYLSDRMYVMYAGKLVEVGEREQVIKNPKHPYTIVLMSAVPKLGKNMQRVPVKGEPPNLVNLPTGCHFHPRCPYAFEYCGWNAVEVAEDLKYLLEGKYYDIGGEKIKIDVLSELKIRVEGLRYQDLEKIIKNEIEAVMSFKSIDSIKKENENAVSIELKEYTTPRLYQLGDGRLVSCLLYDEKFMQKK